MQVDDLHIYLNIALPQVFFKYFASKNQLPGFYIGGTLVENGLIREFGIVLPILNMSGSSQFAFFPIALKFWSSYTHPLAHWAYCDIIFFVISVAYIFNEISSKDRMSRKIDVFDLFCYRQKLIVRICLYHSKLWMDW